MDIDKILKMIQKKVLKGTYLPIEIKEIQAGYLCSPYFKDLYLYLSQNKLPSSKPTIRKIDISREICFIGLIIVQNIIGERDCSPSSTRNMHRQDYNTALQKFVCRTPRSLKTYLTISDKFFISNLICYLRSYIKGCHLCQLAHIEKSPPRQLQARINPNYVPMSRLSMDLKVMPQSHKGHRYILCIIDEVTNYLVTVPISQARSE